MSAYSWSVVMVGSFLSVATPALSQEQVDKAKLEEAISNYSTCQKTCAEDLAMQLIDNGADSALKAVGTLKSAEKAPGRLKYLAFYSFLRQLYATGKKVMSEHVACYQQCDALNEAVVTLGRSGALGPMKRGEKLDPTLFEKQEIIDAYIKFVKPIPLPAEERSKAWGKYIQSLA